MIWAFFEDGDPCWLPLNFQNPHLSLFNARPVILCGRFWDRAEYSHIGGDGGVWPEQLDRVFINRIGSPECDGGCWHGGRSQISWFERSRSEFLAAAVVQRVSCSSLSITSSGQRRRTPAEVRAK